MNTERINFGTKRTDYGENLVLCRIVSFSSGDLGPQMVLVQGNETERIDLISKVSIQGEGI
jgi:hypothetical protein